MSKNINWRTSQARVIIIFDLENNILPLDETEFSALDAWNTCYKNIWEFREVPFRQFKERLRDHRQQVAARYANSLDEGFQLAHDRLLFPRKTHNHRGEPVFDLSPAKPLLQEDVKNSKHTTMSSRELWETRPEYRCFKPCKFKDRIHQEVRRQKFMHYLQLQRASKEEEYKKNKNKNALSNKGALAMDESECSESEAVVLMDESI
jgi:hypothetical protein